VRDRPTFICSFWAGETKTWPSASRAVNLLVPFLLVLETSEYPSCLAFLERAVSRSFYGKYPSSRNKVSGLLFPGVNQVEYVIFEPALIFRLFGLAELFSIVPKITSTGFFPCSIDSGLGREGGRCGGR